VLTTPHTLLRKIMNLLDFYIESIAYEVDIVLMVATRTC
jgi:hypothetical protein